MIQYHGYESLEISSLILPGDFRARLESEHVQKLADSIKANGGIMQAPVVEKDAWKLIMGGDRIAASILNGTAAVECRLVSGTDAELERMMIAENLHRRQDDLVPLLRRYLELVEAPAPRPPTETRRGRPPLQRGRLHAQVAEDTGVSRASVHRADPPPPEPEEPFPLEAWGHPVPKSEREHILDALHLLEALDRKYQDAQAICSKLEVHPSPYVKKLHQRLKRVAQTAAEEARSLRPDALCPKCRGDWTMNSCNLCKGGGWITAGLRANLPPGEVPKAAKTLTIIMEPAPPEDEVW